MLRSVLHFLFAAATALAGAAAGAQTSGQLQVTATVRAYSSLAVLSQPRAVLVSAGDVARGYVDVPAPLLLAVESNTRQGHAIVFERHGSDFPLVDVQGLGQRIQVASQGMVGWRPAAMRSTLEFQFRLQLAPHLAPGEYQWPILLSMTPA